MRFILLTIALAFSTFLSSAQTLIINEVSNGPSGTKEYVEFVVVDQTVVYDCGSTAPPCIDIRGWIFDDNNGWHGPTGIAGGALRFSFDPLWECVPVGTIILVYNDGDFDGTVMPADDLSMLDGNCRLVVPVSNTLIERNATTPGDVACSYPAAGWIPGGIWTHHGLNNTADCARLVDLSGCEVFSVCYGAANNLNTLIYFNGAGGQRVYFFNGIDPYDQSNWTNGCASPGTCGTQDQTPGAPNNAANAAYIAQFNNGCTPIPPVTISASSVDGACACTGEATAVGGGSIPGYTYEWFDSGMTPIGQTAATATNLCDGTYFVTVTSSIGCQESTSVTITNGSTPTASILPQSDICFNAGIVAMSATPAGGTWSASCGTCIDASTGELDPLLAGLAVTVNYDITGSCPSSDDITFNITQLPDAGSDGSISLCPQDAPVDLFNSLNGLPDAGGTWSPALTSGTGVFDPTIDAATIYIYDATNGCGSATASVTVTILPLVDATIDPVATLCVNDAAIGLVAATGGGVWTASCGSCINASTGEFDPSAAGAGNHTINYTLSGTCGNTDDITINVTAVIASTITPVSVLCVNEAAVALTAANTGGTWSATCGACVDASTGAFNPNAAGAGTHTVTYTISGSCGSSDTETITVSPVVSANINAAGPLCDNGAPTTITAVNSGGIWSASCGNCINTSSGVFNPSAAGAGSHTVSYTSTGNCSETQSIIVIVNSMTVIASANTTSGSAPLIVNFSETGMAANTWSWDFTDGGTSTDQNPAYTFNSAGSYTVTVTGTDGICSDAATITITVESDLFIPNAFSPDNDGFNDFFVIQGLLAYPGNSITIMNRWGDKVFSASPYVNDWDGTSNNSALTLYGKQVVDGTYFYFLELEDGRKFNGFVVKKSK